MAEGEEGGGDRRIIAYIAVFLLLLVICISGAVIYLQSISEDEEPDLVIYTYESFQSYGLGPAVIPIFEEMYDVKVKVLTPGDVGTIIGKMILEKNDPIADVVIGIDNSMLHRAVSHDLLEPYIPDNIDRLDPSMNFDPDHYIVPFDYGYIAILCNGEMMVERNLPIPTSVLDLSDPIYRDQMILLDPATSSTGSSFMIWAAHTVGDDHKTFFNALSRNAGSRVLGSWDAMYTAWSAGEAPICISYGLDAAYEVMWGDDITEPNANPVVPNTSAYRQIEGAGLVKGAKNPDMAKKFLDFILTDEFQSKVENNYMLPVVPSVEINQYFSQYGAFAEEHSEPTTQEVLMNYDDWMDAWDEAFS